MLEGRGRYTQGMRRWWIILVLVVVAAACGQGAEEAEAPAEPVTIRMGWGVPGDEAKYVMIADPEVAPNLGTCYDLEWTQLSSTALGMQSLAAGTLDAATVGSLAAANGIERGAEILLTGQYLTEQTPYFSTTWLARDDGSVETVADLADMTVGTSGVGNPTNYIQEFYIADEADLAANEDYEVVELTYPLMEETLATGEIVLGPFAQPFYGRAMATGEFREVFSVTDVKDGFVQLIQAFTRDFAEANPEAVRCFSEDLATVSEYIADEENRDAVIAATAEVTEIPAEVLESFLLTEDDYFRPERAELDTEGLQETWDFFLERGGISEPLDVSDYVLED